MDNPHAKPDKEFIRRTFDSISPRYDLLNQILSFGSADQWRRKAANLLLEGGNGSGTILGKQNGARPTAILDVGVGTGDFLKWFLKARSWERSVGTDFSAEMLERAKEKLPPSVELFSADFHELPFEDSSFDLIVSAFTLRSVQHMPRFLSGLFRILKPGGRVGFLDLTRPRNRLHKLLFFPYLRIFLPVMGWLISGHQTAYQFLSQSVDRFQTPEETMRLMADAGFKDCHSKSFSFGAATLIIGHKSALRNEP